MDQILVLQYRRKGRRLQIIVLPYSMNISAAALIRFITPSTSDDSLLGWRVVGIMGAPTTLRVPGLPDFEGDSMMEEVFKTPFITQKDIELEARGLVDTQSWDMSDLVSDKVPRALLTRVKEQIDNWV